MLWLRVLSRRNLSYSARHSSLNPRLFILLQTVCRRQRSQPLWNQANPNSFDKIPGVGVSQSLRAELRFRRPSSTNPFASYHIPVNPAVSGNYALFCATARRYPSCNQEVAHSFCRHGGVPPEESILSVRSVALWQILSYSEGPSGRKYWVPLTGSWRRRRSCCRSALRSTKSISEVLMTRRSEAA